MDVSLSESSQVEKDLLGAVYNYLVDKVYPKNATKNEKRVIRRKAMRFEIVDGELYFKKKKKKSKEEVRLRYIFRKEEQTRILKACHIDPTSGHMGIKKTVSRITERFLWPGVISDVKHLISTCDQCQRTNRRLAIGTPALNPVPVKSPWHRIGIDFIGPLIATTSGNRYILTVSDYCTKWVEAIPTPTKQASEVSNALFKIFMRMGLPHIITSDQGGEFVNNLNKKLMGKLGIKHHLTTAYHPQANGLVERYNQTLQNMLIKYVNDKQDQWDEFLDTSVFAYNTSVQESTHYSPFELMFGRKATLPIDLDVKKDTNDEKTENQNNQDLQETEEELTLMDVDRLTEKRKELIEEAKLNIKEAQKKQKEAYDRKHARPEGFQVGMKVLKKDFCRKKRANGKLDVKYLGPYIITKVLGKGTYSLELANDSSQQIKKVNGAHLKPYVTPISSPNRSTLEVSLSGRDLADTINEHLSLSQTSLQIPVTSNSNETIPPLPPPILFATKLTEDSDTVKDDFPPAKRRYVLDSTSYESSASSQEGSSPVPQPRSVPQVSESVYKPNNIQGLSIPEDTWAIESVVSDEILSSTMIEEAGFIPPFFPEFVPAVSPITKRPYLREVTASTSNVLIRDFQVKCDEPSKSNVVKNKTDRKNKEIPEPTDVKRLAFRLRERQRESKKTAKKGKESSELIDVEALPSCKTREEPLKWVDNLLRDDEKVLLNPNEWLTDKLMNAGQSLIKECYHQVRGLQSVSLGLTLAFEVQREEFVQVLHIAGNHWVTVSTIGYHSCGEVDVFDSMSATITSGLKNQIAALLCTENQNIILRYRQCQQQIGASDCGLFALAFAAVLASGNHPSAFHFNQPLMRKHLHNCLEQGHFLPFPTKRIGRENRKLARRTYCLPVYCYCRMPETFSSHMIMCNRCSEWFHLDLCVKAQDGSVKKWYCNKCSSAEQLCQLFIKN